MNINEKWNALLEKMKQLWSSEMDDTPDETQPPEESTEIIPEIETPTPEPEDPKIKQARIEAAASPTKPKEDPSVHEFRNSPNRNAYDQDAQLFK